MKTQAVVASTIRVSYSYNARAEWFMGGGSGEVLLCVRPAEYDVVVGGVTDAAPAPVPWRVRPPRFQAPLLAGERGTAVQPETVTANRQTEGGALLFVGSDRRLGDSPSWLAFPICRSAHV